MQNDNVVHTVCIPRDLLYVTVSKTFREHIVVRIVSLRNSEQTLVDKCNKREDISYLPLRTDMHIYDHMLYAGSRCGRDGVLALSRARGKRTTATFNNLATSVGLFH